MSMRSSPLLRLTSLLTSTRLRVPFTCSPFRGMSTHLERTDGSSREPGLETCTVTAISDISPTVKLLKLAPHRPFSFLPGQWLDFFIPATNMVGGYSLCSGPRDQILELAVKYSKHPPAHWVHTKLTEGTLVQVRVGGDTHFSPDPAVKAVLLIAGGIGINPLLSMIRAGLGTSTRYHLLYSASTLQELIFWFELEDMAHHNDNFSAEFFLTKESVKQLGDSTENGLVKFKHGRITPEMVNGLVDGFRKEFGNREEMVRCFLCGPPPMIDFISNNVNIKCEYEKWW